MRIYIIISISLLVAACQEQQKETGTSEISPENTLYEGPIIDMHIHAYSDQSGGFFFGMEHPKTPRGESYQGAKNAQAQMEETLKRFDKYNIVKAVVTGGELWKEAASDRIIIAKGSVTVDSLRKCHQMGQLDVIAELAPFYQGIKANDPQLKPHFDLAEELQIPVGYHIFPGGPPGGIYQMGMKDMRVANAHPGQIEEVLVSHPKMKIYIMHGGWPYLEEMKALMYAHPQIYVDIGVIDWILPEEEFHHFLKGLIDAGYGKRILFGTDQMVWAQTIDVAVASVNSAEFLSWEQKEDIFYNNAARFLELDEEEIRKHKSK